MEKLVEERLRGVGGRGVGFSSGRGRPLGRVSSPRESSGMSVLLAGNFEAAVELSPTWRCLINEKWSDVV